MLATAEEMRDDKKVTERIQELFEPDVLRYYHHLPGEWFGY